MASLSSLTAMLDVPEILGPLSPITFSIFINLILSQLTDPPTIPTLLIYFFTNSFIFTYNLTSSSSSSSSNNFISTALNLALTNVIFLTSLAIQTAIRRIWFHPLSRFPGPKLRAVTGLVETWDHAHGRNSRAVHALHKHYSSPIIRTAPNQLTILSTDSFSTIFPRSCTYNSRGPFYDLDKIAGGSLLNIRDTSAHKIARRIWDTAFRVQALDGYADRVEAHVERCIKTLYGMMPDGKGRCEREVKSMLGGFSFDVMADLGFGVENYGMQDGTGDSKYFDKLHSHMRTVNVVGSLRNLIEILAYMPLDRDWQDWRNLELAMIEKRRSMGINARKDIFAELVVDPDTNRPREPQEMIGDIDLLVIAGSDTTSSAFTTLIFEICSNPELQSTLLKHLKSRFTSAAEISAATTKNIPYLDALINENLRLWPPVPSGAHARLGPKPATIAGSVIPPHTILRVIPWAMHHDDKFFSRAEEFIPERWLDGEMGSEKTDGKYGEGKEKAKILDRTAFMPFSAGPHGCVGKQLAMMEMRVMIARLVWEFEMRFLEGKWMGEEKFRSGYMDYYTALPAEVWVEFRKRL